MKSILLPTDFSNNALSAIQYAIKLYAQENCTFYIFHAWSFPTDSNRATITSHYVEEMKEASEKKLSAYKDQIAQSHKNAQHTFRAVHTDTSLLNGIEASINQHNIDLIVMGTKGATGAKELFFGSNTIKVVKNTKRCDVLIIPDNYQFEPLQQIAFPTDFTRSFDNDIAPLKKTSALDDTTIQILHIGDKQSLHIEQLNNLNSLKRLLHPIETDINYVEATAKKRMLIGSFIEDFNIDMLVMIVYKHNFIENLINEPVVNKLGSKAAVPFYIIKSKNE
ncbi:universal stress protein [uncultured Dokdonia sp.]|uniref:universal stress protein n=1 Tax=uncultured Dokdonia sp. TaxID=575653 RepID=UPI0026126E06|nr:universal stress protein [uncultured Dokdonia sp.]